MPKKDMPSFNQIAQITSVFMIMWLKTHNMAVNQPSFTRSKWNMGEILQFYKKKDFELKSQIQ